VYSAEKFARAVKRRPTSSFSRHFSCSTVNTLSNNAFI